MIGCSNKHQTEELQTKTTGVINDSEEVIVNDIDDDAGEEKDSSETVILEGLIKEQSFDVKLDGWGEVTFASFMPEENDNMDGDVRFKLLKDNEEVYSFPGVGVSEDNCRFNQCFGAVVAVAFKDYNADGKKDIVIINEYAPQSGPNMDESYNEVRIYTQFRNEKEFSLDNYLSEFLIKNYYNDSIASVMEGIEEYQKSQVSYYGDFRVTACKGTAAAYALSQEEIEDIIGTTLSYQADSYVYNKNAMDISQYGYGQDLYNTDNMYIDFNVSASDLGITEEEVLAVGILVEGDMFGSYFYVLDENTLLIYYQGVFFEACRETEE
jgi:hypothetical protein